LVGEQRSKGGHSHYPWKYSRREKSSHEVPVLLEKVEEICVNVTGLEITLWAIAERPIG
jgi:hypothetical protein